MQRRPGPPWCGVLLGLSLALASGCASVRSTFRDWNNDDMLGKTAPALAPGSWVRPQEAAAGREEATPWRLLVFFNPL